MKPLNLDNKPCTPTSSNCIVWQGPDIECINLCTGDTVSDVVHKLATELCTIMTQLKVSSYDLTCLGITSACPPENFTALLQFLIAKICELEKIDNTLIENAERTSTTTGTAGCPDCVVSVASCFVVGTTTTMQLSDYVDAIATRVCALVGEISILQNQITNLNTRVTTLEQAPPPSFTIPTVATDCFSSELGGAASAEVQLVLGSLLSDTGKGFCSYITRLGLPADLFAAVSTTAVTDATAQITDPTQTMSAITGWVSNASTVANTINNLWLAIKDARGLPTITFTDTDSIDFTQIAGAPAYNFSAKINQPSLTVNIAGLGIALNASNSGLVYNAPGYLQNPLTTAPSGDRNATRLDLLQKQSGSTGGTQTVTNNSYSGTSPYNTTTGVFTVPSDGIYDLGFRCYMVTAPATSTPNPPEAATGGYGVGKGWFGGTPTKTDSAAATLSAITTAGTGYVDGMGTIPSANGDDAIVWITQSGGALQTVAIINGGSGFDEADVGVDHTIWQDGAAHSGRIQIASLTVPTPTVAILAGIQTVTGSSLGTNYASDLFTSNTSMPIADLNATGLGIPLTAGTELEFRIGILTNDNGGSGTTPNAIWAWSSTSRCYFSWFVRKMGPLVP